MDVAAYRRKNRRYRLKQRLLHPWPFYKRVGGIAAVVKRADGTVEDLGKVAEVYLPRGGWKVKSL